MKDNFPNIIQTNGSDWYVETRAGFDGPFATQQEASQFHDLMVCSNAARIEFAGLAYAPLE